MSIQHVFESARRLGLPVIVTDLGGRDPMVVLPLDQFEALASESPVKSLAKLEPQIEPRPTEAPNSLRADNLDAFSDVAVNQDIPIDERFYLEPVDDEKAS